ncbi:MAG: hypothetical protein KGJ51_13235, partial [Acidobacteriota bacterium]|nr:hypothetical protein [Acidobacteriota bacterium]
MKKVIAIFLFLGVSTHSFALGANPFQDGAPSGIADGILQSIENANVTHAGKQLLVTRKDAHVPLKINFTRAQGVGVQYERNQWWILPISETGSQIDANRAMWILPLDGTSKEDSWHIELHDGGLRANKTEPGLTVTLNAESVTLSKAEARPHSDPFGHRFSLEFAGGAELENALAAFYWGTILPSVVEKT